MKPRRILVAGCLVLLQAVAMSRACEDRDGDGFDCLDCDDNDAETHPGALETCNAVDDDCDGSLDEGCDRTCDQDEVFSTRMRLDPDTSASDIPVIAWGRDRFAVLWSDFSLGAEEVFFAGVNTSGEFVKAPFHYAQTPGRPESVDTVRAVGGNFASIVTMTAPSQKLFELFSPAGALLSPPGRIVLAQSIPGMGITGLCWNGHQYLVSWAAQTPYPDSSILLSRISADGALLSPVNGEAIVVGPGFRRDPQVAWNGSEYGMTWIEDGSGGGLLYFRRLDAAAQPIGGEVQITSEEGAQQPRIVWAGNCWAIAFQDLTVGAIALVRLDINGVPLGPRTYFDSTTGVERNPELAWNGQEYGLLWIEPVGLGEAAFARGDSSGAMIPGSYLHLTNSHLAPYGALAWNGHDYGTVVEDNAGIYFRRIGCNCADVDGDGFSSCAGGDCNDFSSAIRPGVREVCDDSVDNNCDGLPDCSDTTSCPPKAGTPPGEVTGDAFLADRMTYTWNSVAGATRYDVSRGKISILLGRLDYKLTESLANDLPSPPFQDAAVPPAGDAYYYLVRAGKGTLNKCLNGTWGTGLRDQTLTACP